MIDQNTDLSVPENIKAARLQLGISQIKDLEALLETGADTVRQWESGRRPIPGPAKVALRLLLEKQAAGGTVAGAILEPTMAPPANQAARAKGE